MKAKTTEIGRQVCQVCILEGYTTYIAWMNGCQCLVLRTRLFGRFQSQCQGSISTDQSGCARNNLSDFTDIARKFDSPDLGIVVWTILLIALFKKQKREMLIIHGMERKKPHELAIFAHG